MKSCIEKQCCEGLAVAINYSTAAGVMELCSGGATAACDAVTAMWNGAPVRCSLGLVTSNGGAAVNEAKEDHTFPG